MAFNEELTPISTLLDLLKQNVRITCDDGFYLQGDNKTDYIDVGNECGYSGNWILNEEGLQSALKDIKKMREDLHSEEE